MASHHSTPGGEAVDPVVHEVPVVLSTELLQQVYILQQHLRSAAAPLATPASAEFREANETLTVEYELDKRSKNYDADAEEWNRLSKLPFDCHPAPMRTHYVLGTMHQGELWCACSSPTRAQKYPPTPHRRRTARRTSARHVPAATLPRACGLRPAQPVRGQDEGCTGRRHHPGGGECWAVPAPSLARQRTLQPPCFSQTRVRRRETQRAAAARKNSHAYAEQLRQCDERVPLEVHAPTAPGSKAALTKLLGTAWAGTPVPADVQAAEYVDSIKATGEPAAVVGEEGEGGSGAPGHALDEASALASAVQVATGIGAQPGISAAVTQLAQKESGASAVAAFNLPDPGKVPMPLIRRLPLHDMVGILLKRATALSLPALLALLPDGVVEEEVVSAALHFARPIHGLFVLRTQHWIVLPSTLRLFAGDLGLDGKAIRVLVETLASEARAEALEAGGGRRSASDAAAFTLPLHTPHRLDLLAPIARVSMSELNRVDMVRDCLLHALLQEGLPGRQGISIARLRRLTGTPPSLLTAMLKGIAVKTPNLNSARYTPRETTVVSPGVDVSPSWHLLPEAATAGPALQAAYPGVVEAETAWWHRRADTLRAFLRSQPEPAAAGAGGEAASPAPAASDALGLAHHTAEELYGALRIALEGALRGQRVCSVRYLAGRVRVQGLQELLDVGALPPQPKAAVRGLAAGVLPDAALHVAADPPAAAPLAWYLSLPRGALMFVVDAAVRGAGSGVLADVLAEAEEAWSDPELPQAPLGELLGRNEVAEEASTHALRVYTPPSNPASADASTRDAVIGRFAQGTTVSLKKADVRAAVEAAVEGGLSEGAYKRVMPELAVSDRSVGWVRKSGEWDDAPLQW